MTIKKEFQSRYRECRIDRPAKYKLKHIQAPFVFSVDCVFEQKPQRQGGPRCDEFIFFDRKSRAEGMYLVERKTNSTNVEKVAKQLQGGADFMTHFLNDDPALDEAKFDFLPVWVSNGIKSTQRHQLQKKSIALRGKNKPIQHSPTGQPLPPLARVARRVGAEAKRQ